MYHDGSVVSVYLQLFGEKVHRRYSGSSFPLVYRLCPPCLSDCFHIPSIHLPKYILGFSPLQRGLRKRFFFLTTFPRASVHGFQPRSWSTWTLLQVCARNYCARSLGYLLRSSFQLPLKSLLLRGILPN
jgi:hypothetical protein